MTDADRLIALLDRVGDPALLLRLVEHAKSHRHRSPGAAPGPPEDDRAAKILDLLHDAKVADSAQLLRLLDDPKIASLGELERLLASPRLADGAELGRLLVSPKLADGAQLENLLGRFASGNQLEQLFASADVASGADLIRLSEARPAPGCPMRQAAGSPPRPWPASPARTSWRSWRMPPMPPPRGASRACRTGSASWPRRFPTTSPARSASCARPAAWRPSTRGSTVDIAGDVSAPVRPGTTDPMPSFDIEVRGPGGAASHSVEVTTVDAPVRQASDLTNGVRHAGDKAASRIAEVARSRVSWSPPSVCGSTWAPAHAAG